MVIVRIFVRVGRLKKYQDFTLVSVATVNECEDWIDALEAKTSRYR